MDYLAVELLERIFILACTDGGCTGASLSRVSKRVRNLSRVARFHAVALLSADPAQVAQFHTCYARERAQARGASPRVRHLHLSSAVRHIESAPPVEVTPVKTVAVVKISDRRCAITEQNKLAVRKAVQEEQRRYSDDVAALLRLVAPDLHSLTLVHCHRYGKLELLLPDTIECPGGFPLLRELTIAGNEPKFTSPDCDVDTAFGSLFPRLDRLHLCLAALGGCPSLDLVAWADRAPTLTYLRISGVDFWPRTVLESVKKVFESTQMNQYLKRVIIQPHCPPPMGGPCGTPPFIFNQFLTSLDDLRRSTKIPTALLPPAKMMKERDWEEVMYRDWLDRICGGLGCWDVARRM